MKKSFLIFFLGGASLFLGAQSQDDSDPFWRTTVQKPDTFYTIPALSITAPVLGVAPDNFVGNPISRGSKKKKRTPKYINAGALPLDLESTVRQHENGTVPSRAPLVNFDGGAGNSMPLDPSGAAGPNHYMQAMHMNMQIWDKDGTSVWGPSSIGTFFPGNPQNGDPIVMYDAMADRWFMSQFGTTSDRKMYIAISKTADPTGEWYAYEYSFSSFPDYMKFSIWHDGYYMTANMGSQNFTVFNREKMIAGDASAEMIAKTASVPSSGFTSGLPAHSESATAPTGPQYFYYLIDDAWGGINADGLRVFSMETTWGGSPNATVTEVGDLAADAFSTAFSGAQWSNIPQLGTTQKIDELSGFVSYRVSYRSFSGYNAAAVCHVVNVGGDRCGIKWYELRQTAGTWAIYQQGVYAPDDGLTRWCPSIGLDYQGNIGLAYSVSSSTMYPALRYTGRRISDPVGTMPIAEEVAHQGTGPFTGANRYGDYAHLSCDPDGKTFWMTSEYAKPNGRATRVFSFKIASDFDNDIGATAITDPTDGILTATESITIDVTNFGLTDQSNFPVSYSVNGGVVNTELYTSNLAVGASGTYTFNVTTDMSAEGTYSIVTWTGLVTDQETINDTTSTTVQHLSPYDVGVTAVISPVSGSGLGATETVTVTVKNFGTSDATGFNVSYTINGGAPVTESYSSTIAPGVSTDYIFTSTADLNQVGEFNICSYTDLANDGNTSNDTTCTTIEKEDCMPTANCSEGDGFLNFTLEDINNTSTCSANGYGDFTDVSTILYLGESAPATYTISAISGYADQSVSVWIDFNDNYSFESDELVVTNQAMGTTAATFTFSLPLNTPLGEHIMRARSNYDADSDDPCAVFEYGETEDYTVDVRLYDGINDELNPVNMMVSYSKEATTVTIQAELNQVKAELFNSIGQLIYSEDLGDISGVTKLKFDYGQHAEGSYMIKLSSEKNSSVQLLYIH